MGPSLLLLSVHDDLDHSQSTDKKGVPFAKGPSRCAKQLSPGQGGKPARKTKWPTDKTMGELKRMRDILAHIK